MMKIWQCTLPLISIIPWLAYADLITERPPPSEIWQVKPPLNSSDTLYGGWDQISVVKEIEVQNGVTEQRTYSHHPELYHYGDTTFLAFSSAPVDEDSMGQDVRISVSKDAGLTWGKTRSIIPAALLPNQTNTQNFTYWCSRGIVQRAWQPLKFINLGPKDGLYLVGQSASIACPQNFQAAGKIARQIDMSGSPLGDPCWLEMNNYTQSQLYEQTIFGTRYGMKFCAKGDLINAILETPPDTPAWSSWLYNHKLYAADNTHDLQEQTHGVWFPSKSSRTGGYWQRFWRDISAQNNSLRVWVEYNEDRHGDGWYPRITEQYGNKIWMTNIPDAKTKQFFGSIQPSGDRYFVSDPRYDPALARQPLTIATSRGNDRSFKRIGVLRTNASTTIAPETRDQYKNHGFSYPSATQVGGHILVAYSENKENIWVSVVRIDRLP